MNDEYMSFETEHNYSLDDSPRKYTDEYFENYLGNYQSSNSIRNRNRNVSRKSDIRNRRNNNTTLIGHFRNLLSYKSMRVTLISIVTIIVLITIVTAMAVNSKSPKTTATEQTETTLPPVTKPVSYQIQGVPVIPQTELKAGCEVYACTMLLKSFGFDIDEYRFSDEFLITKPVYYGIDGNLYGPAMDSAYAGDIYTGHGIYAPAMAKCMNNYIKTTGKSLKAYHLSDVPFEQLCDEYILNDIPVMVWETTYMQEPYVKDSWIVDYVDENSKLKIGDTESWQQNEHCMVLIGFDEKNYYFCDSVAGKIASYDRKTAEERYSQIGKQAIVVK